MNRRLLIPLSAALLSLTLIAPAAARKHGAAAGMEPTAQEQAVHQLRQQIAAEELAVALALSADQRDALAAVIADLIAQREARHAERTDKAADLQELLEDYLAEVQKNGSVSEETAQALRQFRAANRPDPENRRAMHREIRDALQRILTEAQRELLQEFRPMSAAGPTDAEREERRTHREQQIRERGGDRRERGAQSERSDERHEMRRERGERKHTRRVVRDVMFSVEFLDVLSR
jgi:hypothetical protein